MSTYLYRRGYTGSCKSCIEIVPSDDEPLSDVPREIYVAEQCTLNFEMVESVGETRPVLLLPGRYPYRIKQVFETGTQMTPGTVFGFW